MNTKHIHKFKRTEFGKNKLIVYKCILDCTTYLREEFIEGKVSLCHTKDCENTVTITKEHIYDKTITLLCESCKEVKRARKDRSVKLLEKETIPNVTIKAEDQEISDFLKGII